VISGYDLQDYTDTRRGLDILEMVFGI
jgi:hypothetical protein